MTTAPTTPATVVRCQLRYDFAHALPRVIVNADDFGFSDAVNRGIIAAFEIGLISSTTLMANQGGFEEAVELAHEHRLQRHVGVHLVLTSGTPLTEPIRGFPLFCDTDGAFRKWQDARLIWRLGRSEHEAMVRELRTQVERVRAAGLPVTHVDSHHHVHNHWGIGSTVIALVKELKVPYVRLARNCGPQIAAHKLAYKRLFNWRLRRRGLAATRWFGEPQDWLHLNGGEPTTSDDFELMVHPLIDEQGRIIDSYCGGNELRALLAPILGIESARSYAGARYMRRG